jgi:predicted translin family RNA/ssDNA-binding protein
MIDQNDFNELRKEVGSFDEKRELLIKDSRNVVKLSKLIIYSLHRNGLNDAEKLVTQIKEELAAVGKHASAHDELKYSASYKMAVQEYVEAMAFFIFLKEKRLVTRKELNVDPESYLLGVCDLTGELARKAINSAIAGDFRTALEIKDFVSDLYGEFLRFDFRNGALRKKFDSIKYDLKKLEDLIYDIKTKGLA